MKNDKIKEKLILLRGLLYIYIAILISLVGNFVFSIRNNHTDLFLIMNCVLFVLFVIAIPMTYSQIINLIDELEE